MQRKHVSNLRSMELPSQFKETNLWEHCPVNPSLAFFKSCQDLKAESLCFIIITDWIQTLLHDARRRYTSVCSQRAGATTTTPAAQTPAGLLSFQPVIREARRANTDHAACHTQRPSLALHLQFPSAKTI